MKFNQSIRKATAGVAASTVLFGSMGMAFAATLPAPEVSDGYKRYEAEYNDKAENLNEILADLGLEEPYVKMVNGSNQANYNIEHQDGQSGVGVRFTDNNGNNKDNGNVIGNFKTTSLSGLNYDFSSTTSLQFTVEREEAGVVELVLGFRSSQEANIEQKCGNIPVKCNDGTIKEFVVASDTDTPKKQASVEVDMKAGTNIIYVAGPVSSGGWINIDYLDVSDTTDPNRSVEPEEQEREDLAVNPIIKSIYTADPSAHVWSTDPDTLYLYPSHDRYPQIGCNRMDAYHIYSTKNMVDYTDCGEIFSGYDVEWGREAFDNGKFDDGTFMWAPDAAYSPVTGKYYFYYPRPADESRSEWRVGVAVSDYPDHGFVDTGLPIAGIGGKSMIDPAVFTDDDGTSYLYLGGGGANMFANGGCAVAKLNPDMVTLAEEPHLMYAEGADLEDPNLKYGGIPDYHEGPYVFKNNGIYYFMYADNHRGDSDGNLHNRQRYVYSTVGPMGPWSIPDGDNAVSSEQDAAKGVILDPESSDTSHGSMVGFKDKWYMFYHTMDLSGNSALRSVHADEATFAADGSINKVEQTDGSGLLVGSRETPAEADKVYEAEDAQLINDESSIKPEAESFVYNNENVTAVTNLMIPGAAVKFENVDGGSGGRANITFKYSSREDGYLKLNVNGRDYSFINIIGTGGKGFFKGESNITVMLKPGEANTIILSEASKAVSLDKIEIRNLD